MKYEILQVKYLEKCPYVFMRYSFAEGHGFDLKDYEVVYQGEIEGESRDEMLEELFEVFNINHPEDYDGRCLSVSDVVKLGDDYYYCDSIGWKKLN